MHAKVIVDSGASAGKEVPLEAGQAITVGRMEPAGLLIRDDPLLSNQHFTLDWDGVTCKLRDLKTRFGTSVNNAKVAEAVLGDGDEIKAGNTTFLFRLPAGATKAAVAPGAVPSLETLAPPAAATTPKPSGGETVELLSFFKSRPEPLFALLDAARDPMIYVHLLQCKEQYQTLYEGPKGEALAPHGPFLVNLPKESPLLELLLREGWGKSWGMFLTATQPFGDVRRHFRHFLLVQLPDGKEVYFRFYDPRVLRAYLPNCNPEELKVFFGAVTAYYMEGTTPDILLQFNPNDAQPLTRTTVPAR